MPPIHLIVNFTTGVHHINAFAYTSLSRFVFTRAIGLFIS
nr:MAG TPA: hypothetical protein [Caudoviricetes sp.]